MVSACFFDKYICCYILFLLDYIYLTGGTAPIDNGMRVVHTPSVACYSIKTNEWFSVAEMTNQRSSHVTISHGK